MKIKKWHIAGAIFCIIAGSLLHFVYEWSGFHPLFGLIGSVNESVWEHLKLLFFPFLLSMILELWIYGKDISGFFASKAIGVIAGMFFITSVFYTYSGITGKSFVPIDILIFILGVMVSYKVSYKYIKTTFKHPKRADLLGFAAFLIFTILFCMYTFSPPSLGIFKPPI